MQAGELCTLSVKSLARLLRRSEVSSFEITKACLERINALNDRVNAFITISKDTALAQALEADKEIKKGGYRGPLHGIPCGLKDLFAVKDVRCTLGSRLFHQQVSRTNSTVAARLKRAGAILLGKQNMNPLAYGPFASEPGFDYGHTFNPWDLKRISGGSSGGAAASVSAGFCPISIGSDTGGSVRIPAAWCGVTALKPTYGWISRHGMSALSWSLDHPGPIARRAEDCALAMQALAGFDPRDRASSPAPVPDFSAGLKLDIRGIKVGLPREYWQLPINPEIKIWVEKAIYTLEELGAEAVELDWPMLEFAENASNFILLAEAASTNEQLVKNSGDDLWPPLRLRLEAGLLITAADYLRAQKARTLLIKATNKIFEQVDVIAGPAMPVTASLPGQTQVEAGEHTIGVVRAMTQYNEVFNLTGHPAMSLPCGFSKSGLPIGMQLVGRVFDEPTIIQIAHAFEEATGYWKLSPEL